MRLRARLCAFLLSLLCVLPLYASGHAAQDLVPAGSWVYDVLTVLALEEGRVSFADQAPLSVAEVRGLLSGCDYERLSDSGRDAYDRLLSWLSRQNWSFDFGIFSFGFDPSVSLSVQGKSEEEIDWVYSRFQRKPLVGIPMRMQLLDYVTMEATLPAGENKTAMRRHDDRTSIPTSADDFDINFPHDAYMSAGYGFTADSGINLQISQMPISVGRSLSGSIIWSEYMTDFTSVNLEFYSPSFRFNTNVTQLNVDRYYYTHRMDIRVGKSFSFSVIESVLVASDFELRFLNPFAIFHNFSPWQDYQPWSGWSDTHASSFCAVKLSFVPARFLRLYTYLVMDQIQMPNERTEWDIIPNGLGAQAGVESYIPFRGGYVHAWLEGYYALPFLYIKEEPSRSRFRTYIETIPGAEPFYEWIGSPFGPDTAAAELKIGYEVPASWSVSLSYLFAARGENSSTRIFTDAGVGGRDLVAGDNADGTEDLTNWVYPQAGDTSRRSWVAPHGIVEFENRLTLRGEWNATGWLSLMVQPAVVFLSNAGHETGVFRCGLECAVSASLSLPALWSSVKKGGSD